MDNRIFNVNGLGKEMLTEVLRLALWQEDGCHPDHRREKAVGYKLSPTAGLVLLWHVTPEQGGIRFITPLGPEALAEMIYEWLKSDEAQAIPLTDWDRDIDQDGHNSKGWRVYCEDWGRVERDPYAIVAIKPAYMWHGK